MKPAWYIAAMLPLAVSSFAQTQGAIEGMVTDPSEAAIRGASVRLMEIQTGATRRFLTGGDGYYVAPGLAPGDYEIQVESLGFQPVTRRGVTLDAGRSVRVDFQLRLGEQAQSVVVEGAAPLISAHTGDWGSSVGRERLEELPLNGRDLFELAAREPGAAAASNMQRTQYYGGALHMSVNGARPTQNSYRVDGIYVNDATGSAPVSASGQTLGLEAIRELRLVHSPFLAEYGRAAGGMFTAVSKSGSNEFHGSLYEYLRNSAMDARNFFDAADSPIPPLKRNQFGGLIGGPILRHRLFFLANYEGLRSTTGKTSLATTLSGPARQGKLPSGDVPVSASVLPFLKIYPLPNGPIFADGTGQYVAPLTTSVREDYTTGKADYLYSDRLRFDARYTFDRGASSAPDPFQLWNFFGASRYHFAQTGAQWIQSASTLHDFHLGFSRIGNLSSSRQTAAIPEGLSFVQGQGLGSIVVTGLTDVGGQLFRSFPLLYLTNDYQANWNFSRTVGPHTVKAGAGLDRVQFNQDYPQDTRGYYQFSSVANLLAARPSQGSLLAPGASTVRGWRQTLWFAFVQDELRVSRRLQVAAGVRYEPYSAPTEANGLVAAMPDPLHDAATTTGIGLFRNPSKGNVAPRMALAWDVFGNGKTVFRAGAGMFYDLLTTRDLTFAGARMPPFYNRPQAVNPLFPNLALATNSTGLPTVDGLQYYQNQPYVTQLQVVLEHQWGDRTLLRLGYAANRGFHLQGFAGNLNIATPTTLPSGQTFFASTAPVFNPNFQRIAMRLTQFSSSSNALQFHARRRLAGGLRFQVNYTWAKVIDETSNANFNDFMNTDYMPFPLNYRLNRGPASYDLRHALAADWSWQTRRFLRGWQIHGILQAQSGYRFNPLVGFDRAGLRANIAGDLGQRPNYAAAPGAPVILGDPAAWFDANAFSLPAAGTYGNLGRNTLAGPSLVNLDLALHKTLWSRERSQVSLRVEMFNVANHPNFQLPVGLSLFGSNGQRISSAGRITQTANTSRQLQLALRATF